VNFKFRILISKTKRAVAVLTVLKILFFPIALYAFGQGDEPESSAGVEQKATIGEGSVFKKKLQCGL